MYRTPGPGRSNSNSKPVYRVPGGIFDGSGEGQSSMDDSDADEYLDTAESHEHRDMLIPDEDRDAIAIGRGVLTVAKALGAIARAAISTGANAGDDLRRKRGVRGAIIGTLRRTAERIERIGEQGLPPMSPRYGNWVDPYRAASAAWTPDADDIDRIDDAFFAGEPTPSVAYATQAVAVAVTNPLFDAPGKAGFLAETVAERVRYSLINDERASACATDVVKRLNKAEMKMLLSCTNVQILRAVTCASHSGHRLGAIEDKFVEDVVAYLRKVHGRAEPEWWGPTVSSRPESAGFGPFSAVVAPTPADEAMIDAVTAPRPDDEMATARIEPWGARSMDDADDDADSLGDDDLGADDTSEEGELDAEEQAMRDLDESVGL